MSELLLHMLKLKLSAFPKEKATHVTLDLLLLVTFCLCNTTVQCQKRSISHISADPPSSSVAPDHRSRFERIFISILLGLITGLIFSILFACVVRCFIRYLGRTPILKGPVIFSPKIAPKTLQSALANDNQLLGSSPNGKYYKTVLDDGLTVAVKRLEPFDNGSPEKHSNSVKRGMQEELEMLAGLRHRNLMSLRAFVREPDRFCLVYDYMPMGSLEDAMKRVRDNELKLSWELRLRIAVGIVKGLQFLHFSCAPKVLHLNLKPNNVLLDAEFEPRLADCGLAKLMPNLDREVSPYSAPECFQNCRYTDKSDVFSFGVILGVLLTGRNATDTFSGEASGGGSLGQWLQHLQQAGEPREALDKSIIGEEVEEEEMLMAVRIAVVCQSNFPADRPSSNELVSMLTQLHSF